MAYDFDTATVKMRSRPDIVAEMMAGLQGLDPLPGPMTSMHDLFHADDGLDPHGSARHILEAQ